MDERWLAEREQAFSVLDRIWSKLPDIDPAQIEADIAAAIKAVRGELAAAEEEDARDS